MNGQRSQVPPLCARCSKPIYDGTISKIGGQFYHNACLHCVVCQKPLDGFCFSKGKEFYCNGDFTRLFGARCCGCSGIISPSEQAQFVNGYVYHFACFSCADCRLPFKAGDIFYMREDMKLICKADAPKGTDGDSDSEDDEFDLLHRRRTCINDNQLRMLTQSYQSDPRPSRQLIEKLSRKVGLRQRVVRNWFQNRRAKDKQIASGVDPQGPQNTNNGFNPVSQTNHYPDMETTAYHHDNPQDISQSYQLFCPLDYLQPDTMPPNIDLSSSDLRNGEVINQKLKEGGNCLAYPCTQISQNHTLFTEFIM